MATKKKVTKVILHHRPHCPVCGRQLPISGDRLAVCEHAGGGWVKVPTIACSR